MIIIPYREGLELGVGIDTLLQRHIGSDTRVVKSGWIPGQGKYFHPTSDAPFNIDKYLSGHRYHMYASSPLIDGRLTWLIVIDFDDTQPWLDACHETIQKQLASVGLASVYSKRRIGRGHLTISFSKPVDAENAYYTITQAAPSLAECKEVYPCGVKRNGKVSWPLYYIQENKVQECRLVAFYPDCPAKAIEVKGIKSDRQAVEVMLNRAINDASLVIPMPQAPMSLLPVRTRKPFVTDVTPVNNGVSAREKTRTTFNASHTVTSVLGLPVKVNFPSLWRHQEKSASAYVMSEHLVIDYSKGKCTYHDAYDCAVALGRVV